MFTQLRKLVPLAAVAGVAGVILLVLGVLFFRGTAEVFTASVDSFEWNCDSCEHVLAVNRANRTYGLRSRWSFMGAMKPGVPTLAQGDRVKIETTHELIAVTMLDPAGTSGARYTTDREFPPPFGPATSLVGWVALILGILVLGIATWSFMRRQVRLDRGLSAGSLVAGLLCLAPGLWLFAGLSGRFDAADVLTWTFLLWLVAAGMAIVLGIMARRREDDRLARRMAAAGLGLAIALTVGWPAALLWGAALSGGLG